MSSPVPPVRLTALGGSLKHGSSSLTALRAAAAGGEAAGANADLLKVADLDLPPYAPDTEPSEGARRLADSAAQADAMLWSSSLYHGSVSGSFENAIDWLQLLSHHDPPYLSNKVVGLLATAGGTQGLQAINTMDFIVRALRAWAVPLVIPVGRSWQAFDAEGRVLDPAVEEQLRGLGAEVVRAANQIRDTGTCDYADPEHLSSPTRAPAGRQ